MTTFLQSALNGDRVHPAAPRIPATIAQAARAAVHAGAASVHVHAFDDAGLETLDGGSCARVLRAIRAASPGTPISLTTSASIVPDPRQRFRIVEAWGDLPDLVTANQGEPGIAALCEMLLSRGVGVEAGLLSVDDARAFVRSGSAGRCRRVLIEPLDAEPEVAVRHAAEMEDIVLSAGIALEQVHHGYGMACWAVDRRALERGHGIRTGYEDITQLPDGAPARDNAELVAAAAEMIRAHCAGRDRTPPKAPEHRAMLAVLAALTLATPTSCAASQPRADVAPQNYVFFGRDRERIADSAFLNDPNIVGAQLKYTWRELEPAPGRYDFGAIRHDLDFLSRHGKRLFLQLQDVSFGDNVVTPDYLQSDPAYHGGVAAEYEAGDDGRARFSGWAARRWDPAVRGRFALLLQALAREFDGAVEGVVLAETAVGFEDPAHRPQGFSGEAYATGIRDNLSAARGAFRHSCVVIYANFMPHGALPGSGHAFLRGVYAHAESIGVAVGGPDILPYRPFQRSNSLPLIEARPAGTIAAMAVQDGNLADRDERTGQRITVPELYDFAVTKLRLDYIFWGTEEPYYTSEVLPFLRSLHDR